jgi:hypothetical protein
LLLAVAGVAGEVRAFPEAEGFGAMSKGGRGGRDLRDECERSRSRQLGGVPGQGPRWSSSGAGGLITLESPLEITEPASPSPARPLRRRNPSALNLFKIAASDVIVRSRASAWEISHGWKAMLQHLHAQPQRDCGSLLGELVDRRTLSATGDIANITIQWCLIGEV